MHLRAIERLGGEAAIRGGDHVLAAHQLGKAHDAFGDQLRMLVVDDEASVRVALQRYFASKGHEVETTASGKDGLARLREGSFDAVIVDMRMPDLSGEQLYEELRLKDPGHAERVRGWLRTGAGLR